MHRPTKYNYTGDDLGASYDKSGTSFRVWAPTATKVELIIYPTGNDSQGEIHTMDEKESGTWHTLLKGDFHGQYYNYLVTSGQTTHEVIDPYARACGVNGKRGMVVDLNKTNPTGWEQLKTPILKHFTDAIIYELHVRDFTIHKDAGVKYLGKYLGLAEPNTRSPQDMATGLDHLKELGVTHIQLMPCYDFYTIDERKKENAEYNWGYDPQNFNCPEGSYATDPFHGVIRIYEFKKMVKALKENGFRVIMDVVYNHTYLTKDSHLNRLVPGYYYRQDPHGNFTNGSGCGNELATERPMVRKLIADSIIYWAQEYKIDGFRLDLMGLMDLTTVNLIRSQLSNLDPSIILFGEGWTGGHSPLPDSEKAIKGNIRQLYGTGAFNDEFRDAIKGHVFFSEQPGFVNGATGMEESIKSGIVGATDHPEVNYSQVIYSHFPWAAESYQSINYASAHDNLTLWDKLQKTNPQHQQEILVAMQKLALAIVLTAQGVPFLHSGSEFLRTKFGDHNSYKAPDSINQIDWSLKARYYHVFNYVKGLIHLRKSHPGFRMRTREEIKEKLRFLPVPAGKMVGFTINEANLEPWRTIAVIFNANPTPHEVNLPDNGWVVVVNKNRAGTSHLQTIGDSFVQVQGISTTVLVDEKSYWQQ